MCLLILCCLIILHKDFRVSFAVLNNQNSIISALLVSFKVFSLTEFHKCLKGWSSEGGAGRCRKDANAPRESAVQYTHGLLTFGVT